MEYRDKTYVVVRSRASGWDWAVDLNPRTVRGGHAASEEAAVEAAEALIDEALAMRVRKLKLVGPLGEGMKKGST